MLLELSLRWRLRKLLLLLLLLLLLPQVRLPLLLLLLLLLLEEASYLVIGEPLAPQVVHILLGLPDHWGESFL